MQSLPIRVKVRLASDVWQSTQLRLLCTPKRGKPFCSCNSGMLSTSQFCDVWHLAQSFPTDIWWTSEWQELHWLGVSAKTKEEWQSLQLATACLPSSWKPVESWLNNKGFFIDTQPVASWQEAQSIFNASPCGDWADNPSEQNRIKTIAENLNTTILPVLVQFTTFKADDWE